MDVTRQLARILFAIGMIGLGLLGFVFRDFAMQWQPVPAGVPWREGLAYAAAALMMAGGIGLLFRRTAALSARVLFPYLVIWWLLKIPAVVNAPLIAVNWRAWVRSP